MDTVKRKGGRKKLPIDQKKRTIALVVNPIIIDMLENDVKMGKADTANQRAIQILAEHYSKKLAG